MSSSKNSRFTPGVPDFELVITSKKHTKQKNYAGVAYKNAKNGFTLRLKPGVTISWDDEVYLTLWPVGTKRADIDKAHADDNDLGSVEPRPPSEADSNDDFPF